MVDTGIYCTNADIAKKAGTKASATSKAVGYTDEYCLMAEGIIHTMCRKVFATTAAEYTAMPAGGKGILRDAASNLAAIYVIEFDMSGYTSRVEAEDMINILRDGFLRDMAILRDKKNQDFIVAGA